MCDFLYFTYHCIHMIQVFARFRELSSKTSTYNSVYFRHKWGCFNLSLPLTYDNCIYETPFNLTVEYNTVSGRANIHGNNAMFVDSFYHNNNEPSVEQTNDSRYSYINSSNPHVQLMKETLHLMPPWKYLQVIPSQDMLHPEQQQQRHQRRYLRSHRVAHHNAWKQKIVSMARDNSSVNHYSLFPPPTSASSSVLHSSLSSRGGANEVNAIYRWEEAVKYFENYYYYDKLYQEEIGSRNAPLSSTSVSKISSADTLLLSSSSSVTSLEPLSDIHLIRYWKENSYLIGHLRQLFN